jgi:hypothetical protein
LARISDFKRMPDIDHSHNADNVISDASDSKLRVTVIYTSTEGTRAALRTAGALAKDLETRLVVEVPVPVSWRLPLEFPQLSIDFLERRLIGLVAESGIDADEVTIQIRLCRDRRQCLEQYLVPGSLIVSGGKKRWWFREERRLEWFLRKLGHQVMFVITNAKDCSNPLHSR